MSLNLIFLPKKHVTIFKKLLSNLKIKNNKHKQLIHNLKLKLEIMLNSSPHKLVHNPKIKDFKELIKKFPHLNLYLFLNNKRNNKKYNRTKNR